MVDRRALDTRAQHVTTELLMEAGQAGQLPGGGLGTVQTDGPDGGGQAPGEGGVKDAPGFLAWVTRQEVISSSE